MLKRTIPATIATTVCIRFAPVCAVRSMRRRVYNPDRLKYPMKRVGKRGEGKFEQISWEEAFDTIASNMQRLIKEYGNESIYLNYGTGTLGGTLTRS